MAEIREGKIFLIYDAEVGKIKSVHDRSNF